jgi:hypothetical protein
MYKTGSKEQMQWPWKFTWEAWNVIFGAIDPIKSALEGKMKSF